MMKARMVFIQEFRHLVQISPLNRVLIIVTTQRRRNSLPRQNVRGNRRPILTFTTRYHVANADRGSAIIFIFYNLIFLVTLPKNSPRGSTNEYNCGPTRAEPSFAFDLSILTMWLLFTHRFLFYLSPPMKPPPPID